MPGNTLTAMFHIIFLFSCVACEWVEIFQSHQPRLPFRKSTITTDFTTEGYAYKNSSISQMHWDKGAIDRVSNVGRIKPVPNPSVKSPSLKTRQNSIISNSENVTMKHNMLGPLQRNTLASSPSRSQAIDHIYGSNFTTNTNNKNRGIFADGFKNNPKSSTKLKTAANTNRKIFVHNDNNEDDHWIHVSNEESLELNKNTPKPYSKNKNLTDEVRTNVDKHRKDNGYKNLGKHETQAVQLNNDLKILPFAENKSKKPTQEQIQETTSQAQPTEMVKAVSKANNLKNFTNFNTNEIDNSKNDESTSELKSNAEFPKVSFQDLKQNENNYNILNVKPTIDFDSTNADSIEELLKLIKNIANTITTNTRKGLKGKVNYLEDLRDTILAAIEARIEQAWPDDSGPAPPRRPARSAHERGHVEFPSSEGALMTISFLTFAVFLIKLVLQVIHTYKSKAMMVTPAVVAAVGRGTAFFKNKN